MTLQKMEDGAVKSLPSTESDIWVPDHVTPSWVCLPNDQPVLTTVQPGESALCVLESICKVSGRPGPDCLPFVPEPNQTPNPCAPALQAHQLDPTKHYLRLKFLIENQVQFYIPKPEEDVCDLVCN